MKAASVLAGYTKQMMCGVCVCVVCVCGGCVCVCVCGVCVCVMSEDIEGTVSPRRPVNSDFTHIITKANLSITAALWTFFYQR
jgi:hypothetical protein